MRCSEKYQKLHPKYKGVYMSDDWKYHKKETFFKMLDGWYDIPGERIDIDKDIKKYGNKEYCNEYVSIAPQVINLFYEHMEVGTTNIRYNSRNNTYTVYVYDRGDYITVDKIKSRNEALDTYCNIKYMVLLELAEHYKDLIPETLYNDMVNTDIKAINKKYYDLVA